MNNDKAENLDFDWTRFFKAVEEDKKRLEVLRLSRELPQKYNIENPDIETKSMIQIYYAMLDNKILSAEIKGLTKGNNFFVEIMGIKGYMTNSQSYIPIKEKNYHGVILPVNILDINVECNTFWAGRRSLIEKDYYSIEDINESIINERSEIEYDWFDEDDTKNNKKKVASFLHSNNIENSKSCYTPTICNAFLNDKVVTIKILSTTKGGFIVDLFGVNAYLPMFESYIPKNEKEYIGLSLEVRIVRIDLDKNYIIVSRQPIIEKRFYPLEDFFEKVHGRPIKSKYIGDAEDNIMSALEGGYGDVFGF